MMGKEEEQYLRRLGFRFLKMKGESAVLCPTAEIGDEQWFLAWHFFRGRVLLTAPGTDLAPEAPRKESNRGIEDLADAMIERALHLKASDIHLEPTGAFLRLRFRLDGQLAPQPEIPMEKRDHLLAHLKIRAGMDIAEKRRPQDGRIQFHKRDRTVDLRVSTLPTKYGEKMVLRVLDKTDMSLELESLQFPDGALESVRAVLKAPYGLVLVTGPTGSGKTTTLYSCLNEIKSDALNIVTIEDPIEYELEGINQTQVKPEIGVTFSSTLRSFLRQDPNVVMVGEIRDEETAELSVRAALTGHLVLSTLHTNDACGAVPRLCEMNVPAHLLAASLRMVVAQRLVRKLCPVCKVPASAGILASGFFSKKEEVPVGVFDAVGCGRCAQTGYKGRRGVFEILIVDNRVREEIGRGAARPLLRQHALAAGMVELADQARRLVLDGVTTVAEVMREAVA